MSVPRDQLNVAAVHSHCNAGVIWETILTSKMKQDTLSFPVSFLTTNASQMNLIALPGVDQPFLKWN